MQGGRAWGSRATQEVPYSHHLEGEYQAQRLQKARGWGGTEVPALEPGGQDPDEVGAALGVPRARPSGRASGEQPEARGRVQGKERSQVRPSEDGGQRSRLGEKFIGSAGTC